MGRTKERPKDEIGSSEYCSYEGGLLRIFVTEEGAVVVRKEGLAIDRERRFGNETGKELIRCLAREGAAQHDLSSASTLPTVGQANGFVILPCRYICIVC